MDKIKRQILNSCLNNIEGISNLEYQKRVWIRGEGPEVDDFDETICNFFQDGSGIIEHYRDFDLTDKQYQLLVRFRDELRSFSDGPAIQFYFSEALLNTSEWKKIMDLAKEVLKAFNYAGHD